MSSNVKAGRKVYGKVFNSIKFPKVAMMVQDFRLLMTMELRIIALLEG